MHRNLDIFWRSLHFFPQKISSLWDQPFCFLAKNTLSIDIFQVTKYLLENICGLSPLEKGLRCFRPKMSTHWFFTFEYLYLLKCYGLTHSALWKAGISWRGRSAAEEQLCFPLEKCQKCSSSWEEEENEWKWSQLAMGGKKKRAQLNKFSENCNQVAFRKSLEVQLYKFTELASS